MLKFNYLLIAKAVFVVMLISTIILGLRISTDIRIDTNLSELNPQNQHSNQTKAAIDQLNDNIERRVLVLIVGADETQVFDANESLRKELSALSGITLHPDSEQVAEQILSTLKPYRFALLTAQQRATLDDVDHDEIINRAKEDLFSLSSLRYFPFNEDPLGWHSDFIQNLFSSLQAPERDSDSVNYHSIVSFSIDEGAMDMRRQESLSNSLTLITQQLQRDYQISIERSGIFFFAADAASSSKKDISFISAGSTVGVVLLLLLAFRSFWSLLLPVASVGLGVAFAFIITHGIYGNVHVLTIVFGASLIGIVIDYSLHYFYHVSANAIAAKPKGNQALYRALMLSLTTSLIGYSSLGFSSLQALQKVAVFSCCGLFMAWLSVICIGEFGTRKQLSLDQFLLPRLQSFMSKIVAKLNSKTWAIVSAATISLALLLSMTSNVFSDDPRLFFKPSEQLLASEKAVAAVSNDYEPGRYVVVQGDSQAQVYARTKQLMDQLSQYSNFDSTNLTSLVNWVPSIEQQRENYQLQESLYRSGGIAERMIEQIGGSSQLSSQLESAYQASQNKLLQPSVVAELLADSTPPLWITEGSVLAEGSLPAEGSLSTPAEGSLITSFMLIHKGSNTDAINEAADQVDGVEFVNTLQRTTDALQQQRYSASKLLLVAYLLVSLLLTLRYRSLKTTGMLLVPICASAMVVIICFSLGQTLNLFHIMALFLVLGFGMDYTIFTREIDHMRAITLQAILLSAITSLLSFGLLSFSSIPVAHSFGITLLIGNCFNLIGVFIYSHCTNKNQQSI